MLIRPAEPADVPGIAEFQTVCWREVYRGIVEQSYLDRVTAADRAVRWGERLATGSRRIALATDPTPTPTPALRSAVTPAGPDRPQLPHFG
ncbi:MAG: hypothetical protein QOI35_1672, partial [Cryptosporangiaceae bacterium]|nr:hypothetical protein [Cryptosporangiaceae bacterium]